MVAVPSIVWSARASAAFKRIYDTIKEESVNNAEKASREITGIIDRLPFHPEKLLPDKFKQDNYQYSGHRSESFTFVM